MKIVTSAKACPKCGGFERYSTKYETSCVACRRASWRRYRATHVAWRVTHPEEQRALQRRWVATHPDYYKLWSQRAPEMRLARGVITRALKKGILTRPSACEECGEIGRPEAAHRDYSQPLDVRWLCRPCHRRWDSAEPKSAYSRAKRAAR